jgi:hypothetical protein
MIVKGLMKQKASGQKTAPQALLNAVVSGNLNEVASAMPGPSLPGSSGKAIKALATAPVSEAVNNMSSAVPVFQYSQAAQTATSKTRPARPGIVGGVADLAARFMGSD